MDVRTVGRTDAWNRTEGRTGDGRKHERTDGRNIDSISQNGAQCTKLNVIVFSSRAYNQKKQFIETVNTSPAKCGWRTMDGYEEQAVPMPSTLNLDNQIK